MPATANSIRRALDRLVDVPVAEPESQVCSSQLDSQDF